MEYVAGASGAVLSAITTGTGVRSLHNGYYIGKKLYQLSRKPQMAPLNKKRKQSLIQWQSNKKRQTVPVGGHRLLSVRPKGTKAKIGTQGAYNKRNESGPSFRAAKVVNRRKKGVSFGKKKKVKVTSKFKQKVAKALEPKQASGKYLEIGYQGFQFEASLYGNKQKVERLGNSAGGGYIQMFSPAMVLNAASVMFNNKTATQTSQFGTTGNQVTFGNFTFDPRTTKLTVKNSYSAFVLRNNTPRTWIISLYEVAPKLNMNNIEEGDSITQWINCMVNENAAVTSTSVIPINIANATPFTLYSTPLQNKMIQQKFKWERHDITLDPGQSYDHYVQGPSNAVYDYAKFWKQDAASTADIFYDYQKKFTRQLIMVARLDLAEDVDTVPGRPGYLPYVAGSVPNQGQLLVEWKNFYSIECPMAAGGTITGVGGFSLENKKDVYFHKMWPTQTNPGTTHVSIETQTDNQ